MEKPKATWLPKIETLVIIIFLFVFLIWSATRCSATKKKYAAESEQAAEETASQDSLAILYAQLQEKKAQEAQQAKEAAQQQTSAAQTALEQPFVTPLYVILDNLNVREEPDTDSKIVDRLKLHDAVQFLNETTEFEEEVDLGDYTVVDRWVKVKTARGKIGWVFGGGVHYFKTKRRTSGK
ncbi:MAG: SH3 domain-containing protein [Saprospiraceae bacterium]|jgi:uncharacterized protein YgiM (DUF1202 family)|nr:SH3 domain-containing protein [Saprospiraceae bacterium]MDP4998400.1 SH3 domain-containing protein [Saprospiraceae bacterium]